jgi:hypothetical protein
MFLDPRYAGVPEKESYPQAAGVTDRSSSLPDTLFDLSSHVFLEAAAWDLQCKVMQIVPAGGK